jgi:hypothetical protein
LGGISGGVLLSGLRAFQQAHHQRCVKALGLLSLDPLARIPAYDLPGGRTPPFWTSGGVWLSGLGRIFSGGVLFLHTIVSSKAAATKERCKAPAVRGWNVCRFHGARGGAPKGRANGSYKHGLHTHEAKAERRLISDLLRQCRKTIAVVGEP